VEGGGPSPPCGKAGVSAPKFDEIENRGEAIKTFADEKNWRFYERSSKTQ